MANPSVQKILITGATGYLAGRIYQSLKNEFEITLGARETERLKNIKAYQGAKLARVDMQNPETFKTAVAGMDMVIHLAALNHQDCEKDPILAKVINVDRTNDIAKAANAAGVSTFVYMSTIHVYGTPLLGKLCEQTIPHPQNVYAKTHLAAELILKQSTDPMKTIVIRLANAIGAPVHRDVPVWALVTNDLCLQAVQDRRMILKSTGLQERNFVSIQFLTQALKTLLDRLPELPQQSTFNVGGPENFTVWDLAQLIQKRCQAVFGYTPDLTRPAPKAEDLANPKTFVFDCHQIEKWTGPEPLSAIEHEIDETLRFCKQMES
jgi:UDP-glucose 4-epimerase